MIDGQKEFIKEDVMIGREINLLREELMAGKEEIKREQNRFAEQLKRGLGEKMLEDVKPKSKIKVFLKKLFSIYG
jgi:hypothetical protein